MSNRFDVIVLGGGLAGQLVALALSPARVALVHVNKLGLQTSSALAQGGIACALGPGDSTASHAHDTVIAGAGHNDPQVVAWITEHAPHFMQQLIDEGLPLDRDASGALRFEHEAAHQHPRVLTADHAQFGAALLRFLSPRLDQAQHITRFEGCTGRALLQDHRAILGGISIDGQRHGVLFAPHVVLATGGCGALWPYSSNPSTSLGHGIALAASVGAALRDLEFVQFHPTGLDLGVMGQLPLLTEALRGAGAILLDRAGQRFMPALHPDAELAPRDVVARGVARALVSGGGAWLELSPIPSLDAQFPLIASLARLHANGSTRLPVRPCAHYHMGGVATDLDGRSSIGGLWALGEVACTGFHGANRLASNSLLEIIVLAQRCARAILNTVLDPCSLSSLRPVSAFAPLAPQALNVVREVMGELVGVSRTLSGLALAVERLQPLQELGSPEPLVAALIAQAALRRTQSLGAHHLLAP